MTHTLVAFGVFYTSFFYFLTICLQERQRTFQRKYLAEKGIILKNGNKANWIEMARSFFIEEGIEFTKTELTEISLQMGKLYNTSLYTYYRTIATISLLAASFHFTLFSQDVCCTIFRITIFRKPNTKIVQHVLAVQSLVAFTSTQPVAWSLITIMYLFFCLVALIGPRKSRLTYTIGSVITMDSRVSTFPFLCFLFS